MVEQQLAACEYKTGKILGQGSYAVVKEAVQVELPHGILMKRQILYSTDFIAPRSCSAPSFLILFFWHMNPMSQVASHNPRDVRRVLIRYIGCRCPPWNRYTYHTT